MKKKKQSTFLRQVNWYPINHDGFRVFVGRKTVLSSKKTVQAKKSD